MDEVKTKTILLLAAVIPALCRGGADEMPVIESVDAAYRLTDEDCREPRPFVFTGTLLTSGPIHSFFKDATGGVPLHHDGISTADLPLFSTIRVRGLISIDRNGERDFLTSDCKLLHTNPPETPLACTCADIRSGRIDYRLAKVRGVIAAVTSDEFDPQYLWASFRDSSGDVFMVCTTGEFRESGLRALVDADVEVTGLVTPISGLRHNLGRYLFLTDSSQIAVLAPAPDDPFRAAPLSTPNVAHRQQASGTVVGVAKTRFFIRTPASRIIPVKPVAGTVLPKPGSAVSVVGFATLDPLWIQLSEAIVRTDTPPQGLPTATAADLPIESLFLNSRKQGRINTAVHGTFCTLRGVSTLVDGDRLLLSSGTYSVFVDLTVLQDDAGAIPPNGSTVEVRGFCVADFEQQPPVGAYPKFRHYTLHPSSAVDIRILSRPSWWTPLRLLYVIASLGVFLIVILIWNRVLHSVSERRGRELYEERIDHALAEQKVEERTRLAVELHDSVSQTLTGVALQLDGGEVETAKTMLASCRGELRRCLWDLRSRTFEEKDMTEAVTRTITPHLNGCAATVRFNVPRERLSESLTHAILRIIRELVVNAIRHGQANHVKIAGEMHENTVSFSVSDDGCGFDSNAAPGPELGHFGLLGIRERIEDFNGGLKIASAPNQGAKFTVTLTTTDEANER